MPRDTCVLLLSHRQESFCTARVAGALAARGARVVRLDTDAFPEELALAGEFDGEASGLRLAGEPPSPLNPPGGCAFHPRCPSASARCASERPELRAVDGHEVACHHPAA